MNGVCICNEGYEKSWRDPRVCTLIQCDVLLMWNQMADPAGPYDVGTVVTVKCESGHHVLGRKDGTEQVLTCEPDGYLDPLLQPCVGK